MKSNRQVSLTFIAAVTTACLLSAAPTLRAADANDSLPPKLPKPEYTGEYIGTYIAADGKTMLGVAKVFFDPRVKPNGGYRATLQAVESGLMYGAIIGEKTRCTLSALLTGTWEYGPRNEPYVLLRLADDKWKGVLYGDNDRVRPRATPHGEFLVGSKAGTFHLSRFRRKSPTLGAAPPDGAVVLLGGPAGKAPSLDAWTNKKWKTFSDGSMMVSDGNNYTVRKFKNFRLHAEFMVVHGKDGGGGNSGFYLLDRYEVQVFDSFGRKPSKGGCAAIYQTFAPSVNACLPAGRWQTYDITFRAAVMEGKKVVKHPRITAVHNGVTVHDDVEIPHATGVARVRGDVAEGPIMLQDHGNPVRYRNMWLVEIAGQ